MKKLSIFLLVGFAVLFCQNVTAQTGEVTASAEITSALSVAQEHALEFGEVEQGANTSVNASTAGEGPGTAGAFRIEGPENQGIIFWFSDLPNVLTEDTEGGSPATLPIVYDNTDFGSYNTTNSFDSENTFDPTLVNSEGSAQGATLSGSGELYVFIGGEVQPAVNQAIAEYEGQIQLTVDFDL